MKEADQNSLQKDQELNFPKSIDINPTAKCNLNCSYCWGPDHNIPDGLSTEDWKNTLRFFAERGTGAVVFTGGEPLVRKDIGQLVQFAKYQGMKVTLSTNTLLLQRHSDEILPYIDEIGIPIDGSNPEANSKMRLGNPRAFDSSVKALHFVRKHCPTIEITVRTVVSKVNKDEILNIGAFLKDQGNVFDRWKLYQFTPVSIGARHREEHELNTEEFNNIALKAKTNFPQLRIVDYPSDQRVGKYVFIGPEGNIFGVDKDGEYKVVGNLNQSSLSSMDNLFRDICNIERNSSHAHNQTFLRM